MSEELSRDQVYERLKEVLISEFGFRSEQIAPGAHLVNDLGLDSIDGIDMAVALEARTGRELKEQELASIRTVQDVVDVICRSRPPDAS